MKLNPHDQEKFNQSELYLRQLLVLDPEKVYTIDDFNGWKMSGSSIAFTLSQEIQKNLLNSKIKAFSANIMQA